MDYFFLKLLEDLFSSPPSSSPELEQNVNVKDVVSGNSLLHICAAKNMVSQVSLLLSLQADPNVTNNNGEIPLHWAVKLNSLRSAVLLIDSRSDVNAVDSSGSSPLHLASENGLPEMVAVLILSPDCNSEAQDMDGCTALTIAKKELSTASTKNRNAYIAIIAFLQRQDRALPQKPRLSLADLQSSNKKDRILSPAADKVNSPPLFIIRGVEYDIHNQVPVFNPPDSPSKGSPSKRSAVTTKGALPVASLATPQLAPKVLGGLVACQPSLPFQIISPALQGYLDCIICVEQCYGCESHPISSQDQQRYSLQADACLENIANALIGLPIRLFAFKMRVASNRVENDDVSSRLGALEVTVGIRVSKRAREDVEDKEEKLGRELADGWRTALIHSKLKSGRWPTISTVSNQALTFISATMRKNGAPLVAKNENNHILVGREYLKWIERMEFGYKAPLSSSLSPSRPQISNNNNNNNITVNNNHKDSSKNDKTKMLVIKVNEIKPRPSSAVSKVFKGFPRAQSPSNRISERNTLGLNDSHLKRSKSLRPASAPLKTLSPLFSMSISSIHISSPPIAPPSPDLNPPLLPPWGRNNHSKSLSTLSTPKVTPKITPRMPPRMPPNTARYDNNSVDYSRVGSSRFMNGGSVDSLGSSVSASLMETGQGGSLTMGSTDGSIAKTLNGGNGTLRGVGQVGVGIEPDPSFGFIRSTFIGYPPVESDSDEHLKSLLDFEAGVMGHFFVFNNTDETKLVGNHKIQRRMS